MQCLAIIWFLDVHYMCRVPSVCPLATPSCTVGCGFPLSNPLPHLSKSTLTSYPFQGLPTSVSSPMPEMPSSVVPAGCAPKTWPTTVTTVQSMASINMQTGQQPQVPMTQSDSARLASINMQTGQQPQAAVTQYDSARVAADLASLNLQTEQQPQTAIPQYDSGRVAAELPRRDFTPQLVAGLPPGLCTVD